MEKILIVEDNKDMQFNLSSVLKDAGFETVVAGDGKRTLKEVEKSSPNLVLLDIKLPDMDGISILEEIKKNDKDVVVIMLTAYGDVKGAVRAMKLGAFDYVAKPFDNEELILIVKKALQTQSLSREVESLRKKLGEKTLGEETMGESPLIKQVLKQVEIIAPTAMTVILQGESGTGKEVIANLIHRKSKRKDKPLVAVDCSSIPETLVESELFGYEKGAFTGADDRKEGKFEQANGGTLFFDEVTNLPNAVQMKLLRVIQERKLQHLGGKRDIGVDVRIIVATNINLSDAVKAGKFRDDLFHRLNEFHINLPPLRERKEDFPILTKYFLEMADLELGKKVEGFSGDAMKFLLDYHWPGNVRELKNVIKKAVLLADSNTIPLALLSLNGGSPTKVDVKDNLEDNESLKDTKKKAAKQIEEKMIKEALAKAGGNKTKAAKILKIDRMTLYSKIKEFQLK